MKIKSIPPGKSSQHFFTSQSSSWALLGTGVDYLQKTIIKPSVQQMLWLAFLLSEEAFHALQSGPIVNAHHVNLAIGVVIKVSIELSNIPKNIQQGDIKKRADKRANSKETKELTKKLDEAEKKEPGKKEDYGGQLRRINSGSGIIIFWEHLKRVMTRNDVKRKAALPVRKTSGKAKRKKRPPKK